MSTREIVGSVNAGLDYIRFDKKMCCAYFCIAIRYEFDIEVISDQFPCAADLIGDEVNAIRTQGLVVKTNHQFFVIIL